MPSLKYRYTKFLNVDQGLKITKKVMIIALSTFLISFRFPIFFFVLWKPHDLVLQHSSGLLRYVSFYCFFIFVWKELHDIRLHAA